MSDCTCTTYPVPHHPGWCAAEAKRKAHAWHVFEAFTLRMWRRRVAS